MNRIDDCYNHNKQYSQKYNRISDATIITIQQKEEEKDEKNLVCR
jgi:hypothetical protein